MNLYLISQNTIEGYQVHTSAVVVAESPEEAIRIYPGKEFYDYFWDDDRNCWLREDIDGTIYKENPIDWPTSIADIRWDLLGKAEESLEKGVILADLFKE